MYRLEQLQQFYKEDPSDPFNLYGLALEISKFDRDQGHTLFQQLISGFPDYVPAYYQSAVLSIELGKPEGAKDVLQKGMEWAKSKNDIKAFHELQQLWNEVEGEI
jgi:lipoprotein NlpI